MIGCGCRGPGHENNCRLIRGTPVPDEPPNARYQIDTEIAFRRGRAAERFAITDWLRQTARDGVKSRDMYEVLMGTALAIEAGRHIPETP